MKFYNVRQEICLRKLSDNTKELIESKLKDAKSVESLFETIHIVGICEAANEINSTICNCLPPNDTYSIPIVSLAIDSLNLEILDDNHNISQFQFSTNLPKRLHIQEGARVMFLTNKLFNHGICNGTIGIVTKIIDHENIKVTFPTHTSITKIIIQKETTY